MIRPNLDIQIIPTNHTEDDGDWHWWKLENRWKQSDISASIALKDWHWLPIPFSVDEYFIVEQLATIKGQWTYWTDVPGHRLLGFQLKDDAVQMKLILL
jgi:hypothetical protein